MLHEAGAMKIILGFKLALFINPREKQVLTDYDLFNFKIFLPHRMYKTCSQSTPCVPGLQREQRISMLGGCLYTHSVHI